MKQNDHCRMSQYAFLLVGFLLFLVAPFNCLAQDFYFNEDPIPGSYRMEYGGIYKVVVEQSLNLLEARWIDFEEELYQNGYTTYSEYNRKREEISLSTAEWKNGLPWYYRRWWESMPESKGGAPEVPVTYYKGHTRILFDIGIIYITSAAEFKWRGIEMAVDFNKNSSITLGVGEQVYKPRSGWKFKIYPNVRIATDKLITTPFKSIRRIDMNIGGIHSIRGKDLVAVIFNTWYNFEERGWFFGLQLKLMQW